MSTREQILAEIEEFLAKNKMNPTTFGTLAASDRALVIRLRNGSDLTTRMVDRLRAFMRDHKPPHPKCRADARTAA